VPLTYHHCATALTNGLSRCAPDWGHDRSDLFERMSLRLFATALVRETGGGPAALDVAQLRRQWHIDMRRVRAATTMPYEPARALFETLMDLPANAAERAGVEAAERGSGGAGDNDSDGEPRWFMRLAHLAHNAWARAACVEDRHEVYAIIDGILDGNVALWINWTGLMDMID
jgi:hypothetical protein